MNCLQSRLASMDDLQLRCCAFVFWLVICPFVCALGGWDYFVAGLSASCVLLLIVLTSFLPNNQDLCAMEI